MTKTKRIEALEKRIAELEIRLTNAEARLPISIFTRVPMDDTTTTTTHFPGITWSAQ